MAFGIIVKNYEHFNRAMGKHIGSRAQYEKEMVKGGFVPFEEGRKMAEQAKARNQKPYDGLSEKAMRLCHEAKHLADKDGKIKWTDKLVKGMEETGVSFKACEWVTEYDKKHGGFADGK